MKKIIIILLVVIVFLIGYTQYKEYKRFSPPEYEYKVSEKADLNYHNQSFLLDYYQAIEELNGYVISQWSTDEIDVRNPEDDDEETKAVTAEYAKKLGKVKFYEAELEKSSNYKTEGLTNAQIKLLENEGISFDDYNKNLKANTIKDMFSRNASKDGLQIGSKGALVFEIQKILVSKGYNIEVDGVFHLETFEAIKAFEEKSNLFADGILDELTLNRLLQ